MFIEKQGIFITPGHFFISLKHVQVDVFFIVTKPTSPIDIVFK